MNKVDDLNRRIRDAWLDFSGRTEALSQSACFDAGYRAALDEAEALRAERDRLREALGDANQLLRSSYAVALRHGQETNWEPLLKALDAALDKQHDLLETDHE